VERNTLIQLISVVFCHGVLLCIWKMYGFHPTVIQNVVQSPRFENIHCAQGDGEKTWPLVSASHKRVTLLLPMSLSNANQFSL